MTDRLKVGDKVIVVAEDAVDYGKVYVILAERGEFVYTNEECTIGYYACTGAGWLDEDKESGYVFARKVSPLEELL